MKKTVSVGLAGRSYDVHIGRGLIADVMDCVPVAMKGQVVFILTDENAQPYADSLRQRLEADSGAAAVHLLPIPPGEDSKSLRWYEKIINWMLDSGVTRRSVLFAVGGGVVGDLAGFCAATVLRGIAFVQVPTTLLAQVDSGIGGKTGIDMPQGKNLVGAFHQPAAVLCDLDTLETLNIRQRLAGYAEILKYGLINDPAFYEWLVEHGAALCDLDPDCVAHAVEMSCRKKAEIVMYDEREENLRKLLNLGHTFAHALEVAAGYDGSLLHGEAVAVGLVLASKLSLRLGYCKDDEMLQRLHVHLKDIGLPASIRDIRQVVPGDMARLVRLMYADKKAETGGLTFVLLRGVGDAFVQKNVAEDDVLAVLNESMNGSL